MWHLPLLPWGGEGRVEVGLRAVCRRTDLRPARNLRASGVELIGIKARPGSVTDPALMKHLLPIFRFVATLATIIVLSGGVARAETSRPEVDLPPRNFLTEHTLVYPAPDGEEHLIHFGKFGNFDWYYPCTFESGSWALDADNVLSLTYDNRKRVDRRYTLSRQGEAVLMIEPDRTTEAALVPGNTLPHT